MFLFRYPVFHFVCNVNSLYISDQALINSETLLTEPNAVEVEANKRKETEIGMRTDTEVSVGVGWGWSTEKSTVLHSILQGELFKAVKLQTCIVY
jgi:hypothetical protein